MLADRGLSKDSQGFFLLIEEEGIDEMAHHSNTKLTIKSGQALDSTVALALDFAKRTPRTLVIVLGDHETGGLAIENVGNDIENGELPDDIEWVGQVIQNISYGNAKAYFNF